MAVNVETLTEPLYIGNGVNRMKVDTDGTATFEGAASGYEDITGHLNSASIRGAAGKADYDDTEDLIVLQPGGNIANNADIISAKYQLKHQIKTDSTLKLHLHWQQPSAGAYKFKWIYRILNNGAAFSSAWSTPVEVTVDASSSVFTYTSGMLNQVTEFGEIPTTGVSLSSIVQVKFTRSDLVSGDIFVYDIDAHICVDQPVGSRTEYSK